MVIEVFSQNEIRIAYIIPISHQAGHLRINRLHTLLNKKLRISVRHARLLTMFSFTVKRVRVYISHRPNFLYAATSEKQICNIAKRWSFPEETRAQQWDIKRIGDDDKTSFLSCLQVVFVILLPHKPQGQKCLLVEYQALVLILLYKQNL